MKKVVMVAAIICIVIGFIGLFFSKKRDVRVSGNEPRSEFIFDNENYITISKTAVSGLNTIELSTIREGKGDEPQKEDTWEGVILTDFLTKHEIAGFEVIQFIASDKYQVMLNQSEIAQFEPIIATKRNGQLLKENEFRLIAKDMPEMHWVSNLKYVIPILEIPKYQFLYAMPFKKLEDHLNLITDPEPFKNVQGYSVNAIINVFLYEFNEYVTFTSRDGISQTLSIDNYLKNAFLIIDNGNYNLQSPEMPYGMWLKNLLFMEMRGVVLVFTENVDFKNDKGYLDFIKFLSSEPRTRQTPRGYYNETDYDNLDWEDTYRIGVRG